MLHNNNSKVSTSNKYLYYLSMILVSFRKTIFFCYMFSIFPIFKVIFTIRIFALFGMVSSIMTDVVILMKIIFLHLIPMIEARMEMRILFKIALFCILTLVEGKVFTELSVFVAFIVKVRVLFIFLFMIDFVETISSFFMIRAVFMLSTFFTLYQVIVLTIDIGCIGVFFFVTTL